MKKLFILGIVMALACAVYAYPTLGGPSGLVTIPTASITPTGQWQVAADAWTIGFSGSFGFITPSQAIFGEGTDSTYPIRANYGLNSKLELGGGIVASDVTGSGLDWQFNAKYLLPFTAGAASWAVGGELLGGHEIDSSFNAYLAATKAFEGVQGTAALLWDDENSDLALGLGAQTTLDKLTLIGEYVNDLPGSTLSFAARYPLTPAMTAQIGFVGDLSDNFIGLNYTFGK